MTTSAAPKSNPLATGDKAPPFSLPADDGKTVSLASLKGKNVVLYFYPKDDTPGCTQESKDFRDALKEFEKCDAIIIGISKDSTESHVAFKKKYCLPFTLISDTSGMTCEDYGTWVSKSMYGKSYMGIERSTFLIDKSGTLKNIWRKVKVDGHVQEVLAAVKMLA